jgi:uncharacterized membrane protein YagU involved in acid resistance
MNMRQIAGEVVVGLAAGLVATRVNDQAQRVLYRWTPAAHKAREPDSEPTSLVAARRTAATMGLPRKRVITLKNLLHYGLGAGWGGIYALLRRNSHLTPLGAGTAAGASLSLIVDETICPAMGFSAPNSRYPVSSHLRGFVTHLIYGLALAVSAEVMHRMLRGVGRR